MEWYFILLLILGVLILLMLTGAPIALCIMAVNLVAVFLVWGGEAGLKQIIPSIFESVTTFTLLPIPLFILMGAVMFYSGIAPYMIGALDSLMGRVPGRLGLLTVAAGTVFATLTGSSMASVVMLGKVLVPEMRQRGYKKPMYLGPILGSGGLAIMIPPSELAVLLGAIGEISIGNLLVAIIIPGILMAILYATYIIGRCSLQPSLAPSYTPPPTSFLEKMSGVVRYVLPVGFIIFMVTGVIVLGIATPTEAAATGTLGTFALAAVYRRLNKEVLKNTVINTLEVTVMIFAIILAAKTFGEILAFTGASRGLAEFAIALPVSPMVIIIAIMVVLLFLGMFMSVIAVMMITLPIFVPVVNALGFDPVWFGVIFLLNMEMATTTPPFGLALFSMKAVVPDDVTMGDLYKEALPFIGCDLIAMILIIAFPVIALWLPSLAK